MSHNDERVRRLIADEAARIILDEGLADYRMAKHKAAERLNAAQTRNLPNNAEIEQAVLDRRRLFGDRAAQDRLLALRHAALSAMRLFVAFEPRLVGPVLSGAVSGLRQQVDLHLFADTVEEVMLLLDERGIPWEAGERRLRTGAQSHAFLPVLGFQAGDVTLEAVVFPTNGIRQAPLSPVDGRPMQRADLKEVERLLAGETGAQA
ncbi:MAG: hypothetical protein PHQ14_02165 [Chromatiales bacterium]|jgi:hypothetical protein|nr:hypothetical protein [Chromatiales bacterium]MDX9767360.1 hypothetical protein [Ectothiorhodospiraceae bacterium]